MSIEDKNKGSKGVEIEGQIIKAEKGAVEKATPVEAIKIINEGDKKIELRTAESQEDKDKKIQELKEVMDKMDKKSEGENNEENKDNKNKEGNQEENKFKAFEIDSDSAVPVEISDSVNDEGLDIVNMISIDSNGRTYGDDSLDYEQLGLKLKEAQGALDRLQKKKEELPPTNKLFEMINKYWPHKNTIDSKLNKLMDAKVTQGIGRLKKRVEYLEGRISKELS
ncbi:MAG: hypothetical protein WC241_01590 [Candidatus Paceibacterota bacterium]|jgi:hypothetical protein